MRLHQGALLKLEGRDIKKYTNSIPERLTGRHKRCMQSCDVKDKKILDIGCSFGWFEKFAIENGCKEIIAIDMDENILSDAKNQLKDKRLKFLKASALDLSQFEANYFDLVVMFDAIEHLPQNIEAKCLLGIKRVLKENGELRVSTPLRSFFSNILDPAWYFGHRHYSQKDITRLLTNVGFKIDKIDYGGKFCELYSMILLYIFKWIFKREIPFKNWFEKIREREYLQKTGGFVTLFVAATNIVRDDIRESDSSQHKGSRNELK